MTEPYLFPMVCVCGHQYSSHHVTPKGKATWCSTWSPDKCGCTLYTPQPEDTP